MTLVSGLGLLTFLLMSQRIAASAWNGLDPLGESQVDPSIGLEG